MATNYPKVMYVDLNRKADDCVLASADPGNHGSWDEPVRVGRYEFVEEVALQFTTVVTPVPKRKTKKKRRGS